MATQGAGCVLSECVCGLRPHPDIPGSGSVEKSVENLLKSKELLLPLQSAKTMRILIIYCNTNS